MPRKIECMQVRWEGDYYSKYPLYITVSIATKWLASGTDDDDGYI